MDVGALRDRGQRRFLGLGDIVEITGVVLGIFDVRIDRLRAVTEFLAGVDDRGNLQPADVADAPVFDSIAAAAPAT